MVNSNETPSERINRLVDELSMHLCDLQGSCSPDATVPWRDVWVTMAKIEMATGSMLKRAQSQVERRRALPPLPLDLAFGVPVAGE